MDKFIFIRDKGVFMNGLMNFLIVAFFSVSTVFATSSLQEKLAQKKEATEKLRSDVLEGKNVHCDAMCDTSNSCQSSCSV